jgi:hypothetical protein
MTITIKIAINYPNEKTTEITAGNECGLVSVWFQEPLLLLSNKFLPMVTKGFARQKLNTNF